MHAFWNEEEMTPYDLLGVEVEAPADEIRKSYFELAKLFHPDHNHGASNAEDRQEHFIRVKRAYQTLSDPEARKVYNMSHNNWEVDTKRRPNLWKRGLREEPEGKDHILAREQFDEVDIRPDALITTCEMCGAPSHFNCYVCQMPVCRFCCLKPHAKDGVVPHYPIRDDPSAAEKSEEQEKKNRLLKYRDEFNPMWYKNEEFVQIERSAFKEMIKRVKGGDIPGQEKEHCMLSTTYAWAQTKEAVLFSVWMTGDFDDISVKLEWPSRLTIQFGNMPPVVQRGFAGGVNTNIDMDTQTFGQFSCIVCKVWKEQYGELWQKLFMDDHTFHRAVDVPALRQHTWERNQDEEMSWVVSFPVPEGARTKHCQVDLAANHLKIVVPGYMEWKQHWIYPCRVHQSTWTLEDLEDGRRALVFTVFFDNLPHKEKPKQGNRPRPEQEVDYEKVIEVFHEDSDPLLTRQLAELMLFKEADDDFKELEDLSLLAKHVLAKAEDDDEQEIRALGAGVELEEREDDDNPSLTFWWADELEYLEDEWRMRAGVRLARHEPPAKQQRTLETPVVKALPAPALPAPGGVGVARGAPQRIDAAEALPPRPIVPPSPAYGGASSASSSSAPPPPPAGGGSAAAGAAAQNEPLAARLGGTEITSYAFDGSGAKNVKVYLSLEKLLPDVMVLSSEHVFVEFTADTCFVAVVAGEEKLIFYKPLAHAVDPDKASFKVKGEKKEVVLVMPKADRKDPWERLAADVNAD